MIEHCPHCGHPLQHPFKNGLSSCLHCSRVFDSSRKNLLLSAAWNLRKNYVPVEVFQFQTQLSAYDAHLVYNWVVEEGMSQDEVLKEIEVLEQAGR